MSAEQDRRGLRTAAAILISGLAATGLGVKKCAYDIPPIDRQISEEITARYDAPSREIVNESNYRLLSDRCGDRACTDQERRQAEVIFERDRAIKHEVYKGLEATNPKKLMYGLSIIGGLTASTLGCFGLYWSRKRD